MGSLGFLIDNTRGTTPNIYPRPCFMHIDVVVESYQGRGEFGRSLDQLIDMGAKEGRVERGRKEGDSG